MTRSLRDTTSPRRILEVGPGTGPFTRYILKTLDAGDEFHIVEINNEFCEILERDYFVPFREKQPECTIQLHQSPIEEADLPTDFDFIVCGLPFNNFPPPVTRSIFRKLLKLLKQGGELAYFEYAVVRAMKSAIAGSDGRSKIKRTTAHGELMRRRFDGTRELVLANFPPAYAVRLRGI